VTDNGIVDEQKSCESCIYFQPITDDEFYCNWHNLVLPDTESIECSKKVIE